MMKNNMKLTWLPLSEYKAGMKVIKCDKSWINIKIFSTDKQFEKQLDTLKSYGVKEILVEYDPNTINGEENSEEAFSGDKFLSNLMLSDIEFVKNTYPKLINELKNIFNDAKNQQLDTKSIENLTETVCSNIMNNHLFVINISKYKSDMEYLYNHSLNIALLANTVGKKLGYRDDKVYELTKAGLLHDIGKLFIDQNILNKKGKLTEREFVEIKKHPIIGYKFLHFNGGFSNEVLLVVLEHHERVNGEGYPRKLKGDQISHFAKIVSILDTYDAITNDKIYKEAMKEDEAIEIIKSHAGDYLSKTLVDFFINFIRSSLLGKVVLLDTNEIGVIIKVRSDNKEPLVLILKDEENNPVTPYIFDLNSYNTKTGEPYKKITAVLEKSEIDFNPVEVMYNYLNSNRLAV